MDKHVPLKKCLSKSTHSRAANKDIKLFDLNLFDIVIEIRILKRCPIKQIKMSL